MKEKLTQSMSRLFVVCQVRFSLNVASWWPTGLQVLFILLNYTVSSSESLLHHYHPVSSPRGRLAVVVLQLALSIIFTVHTQPSWIQSIVNQSVLFAVLMPFPLPFPPVVWFSLLYCIHLMIWQKYFCCLVLMFSIISLFRSRWFSISFLYCLCNSLCSSV